MKKNRLIFVILTVVIFTLTFSVTAFAASQQSGNYKYTLLNDGGVKIIAYLGKEKTVNIPSEIDGKTVTALGFGLFASSWDTHTVIVPDSVITMDGTVQMSNVKNVYLGAGVKEIRDGEFYGVKKLTVSKDNPNYTCVDDVLYDKGIKSLICVPTGKEFDAFKVPEGVENICDSAIVGVEMNYLSLPSTLTHIGRNAISVNGITSLVIPSSVESLSMYAIYQCNGLRSLKFENGNLKQIGSHVVEECENLSAISIPANVESIGKFYACPSLSTIIVSGANKNYTTVDGVLYNKDMTRLVSYPVAKTDNVYTVPDSVFVIGDAAFYNVKNNLKMLYLHKGITEFEYDAFIYSGGFEIYYEGTQTEFDAVINVDDAREYLPVVKYNNYIYRPVTGITAAVTDDSVTLTWDKVSFATGYGVFIRTATGWKLLGTTADNTYTAKGLSAKTEYTFAVRSYSKADGNTVWAPEFTTVKESTALGTPTSLVAVPSTEHITLNWNKVEGASGYRIFVKNIETGKWDIAVRTTGKNTTTTIKNLEQGTKYTFAVRAYVNNGAIVWAPKYKSVNAVTKPGVTTKLTFGSDNTWIKLSWDKVPGATGYRVYVLNNGSWKALKTTADTIYVNHSLKAATKYTYAVRAYTKYNGAYYWADSYAKVVAATAPAVPQSITATKTSDSITLNWSKVSSASGYRVFVLNESNRWSAVKTTAGTSYTVENLESGRNYAFAVRPYINTGSHIVWAASYVTINVKTN